MQAEASARLRRRSPPPPARYRRSRQEAKFPVRRHRQGGSTRHPALWLLRALPEGPRQLFLKLLLQTAQIQAPTLNPTRPKGLRLERSR